VVALLVEITHTDLSEVTRMVLVHIRSVVVLSTSKTTTTWMLAMLSYTTVTGGNMTAAGTMSAHSQINPSSLILLLLSLSFSSFPSI
jgi:hypothetical protein